MSDVFVPQIACHAGRVVEPDKRDVNPDLFTLDFVMQYIRNIFKGVSDSLSIYESCMHTVSLL